MKLKIKEYREELQLTQKQLADKIANVQRNISNWENGVSEPDCETILHLAELFDITIDELFGRVNTTPAYSPTNGIEKNILQVVRKLTDAQKYTLLQFLREINQDIL